MNLLIAFPRTGQETCRLVDGRFRSLVRYLRHRIVVGDGEHACAKQIYSAGEERKEDEILGKVQTGMGIGEDIRGE